MSFYRTPVQPFDPVVKDPSSSAPEQGIRYLRDNFDGDGQDSNTTPPAQNQQLWQELTNIQPIEQGVLSRRWGYKLFANYQYADPPLPFTRMYSLQNNNTLSRQIVYCGPTSITASAELTPIIYPVTFVSSTPRMVDSRNYAYFYSGQQADLLKWDGNINGAVTNWGIVAPGLSTVSTSTVDTLGSTDSVSGSGTAWTNPSNILTNGSFYAQYNITPGNGISQYINVTGLGFAIPSNATITGIQAKVTYLTPNTGGPGTLYATLLKAGIAYGQTKSFPASITTSIPATTSWTPTTTDLWTGSWTPGDVNNVAFGLQFQAKFLADPFGTVTFLANAVEIKVFYTALSSAVSVAVGGAGNVNLTVGRTYYCVFQNSSTGHLSDLNQASATTGPVVNSVINITTVPVSTDTQVDSKILLATADGGDPAILYFVASLPNATTTYTDNTPEVTLDLNQQYLFTDPFGNEFGVTFNDPPPSGTISIKHKGRLWMAQQQNLFFSKSVAELTLPNGFIAGKYEECWNPSNYFDISGGAETISGLFSDGNVIYIGTQSHVRRIFGDGPTNFQQPEICHQDVGVLNQEVWQNVFLQGTPTGFMWLTPDFKVMGSDGNSYLDIGHPIQDVLNSINPTAAQNCHAMFAQQGPYDLYILAIPTGSNTNCDTHCIFNMRSQQWIIWQPTDQSTSMLFNITATGTPQWLFAAIIPGGIENNLVYQYTPLATQDRANTIPVDFTSTAKTSWLHLGSPTTRKVLDEIEVLGDPAAQISVFGASTQGDFVSPRVITSGSVPVLSPFQTYKVYLAGKTSRDKYYQLQFQSTSNSDSDLLNSFILRAVPWNTL